MKFFEKNMKFFVLALVGVVGYYVYLDMKAKKDARDLEEQIAQNIASNSVVVTGSEIIE
jgi:hypothetical protein